MAELGSTGQDSTCENPPTVLIRISPPWFLFLSELLFLAERFGICQGDITQMVLSTLLSQLQMVGQKHTSKDYVPQFAASSKLWRARFRVTAKEPFFWNGSKNNQNQLIPSNRDRSHFVGWFRFFLCLNDLIDPLVKPYLCCKTFAFAFG